MPTVKNMLAVPLLATALLLGGCGGYQWLPDDGADAEMIDDIPEGPGLFTGDDGEFVWKDS